MGLSLTKEKNGCNRCHLTGLDMMWEKAVKSLLITSTD